MFPCVNYCLILCKPNEIVITNLNHRTRQSIASEPYMCETNQLTSSPAKKIYSVLNIL